MFPPPPPAALSAGGGWPPTAACSIRRCWPTGRPRSALAPPGRSAGRGRAPGTARRAGAPIGLPGDGGGAVVHAPTPTDEPLGLPAVLLASFPLSPDRRHVAPGPLTDFLVERAADVFAGLLPGLASGPGLLDLVPGPVGRGELDARLSRAIASRLPDVAFLPAVAEAGGAGGVAEASRAAEAGVIDRAGGAGVGDVAGGVDRTDGGAARVRPRD